MSTTVVPINPRHWQEMLWEDQTLWDDHMPALVLAELDERVWNVMDRQDPHEQTLLLALKHGYTEALEGYVANLEASDREMAKPRPGKREAWVFDFPMESILQHPEDAIATAIVPRVEVEPEPEPETVEQPVVPVGRKLRKKHGTRR